MPVLETNRSTERRKNTVETTTAITDASANAAEGALAASGGSAITVNTVAPEIVDQAFAFGRETVGANRDVSQAALNAGLESLRVTTELVPRLVEQTGQQTQAALTANAALARGVQTGGASALLEGPTPYVIAAIVIVGLIVMSRKG